jgi:ketosteroid isomerase-like protein
MRKYESKSNILYLCSIYVYFCKGAVMKRIRSVVILCISLLLAVSTVSAEERDHEIHNELRQLVRGIETAVNTEKYGDLKQYFHKSLRVTTVNQNTITSYQGIEEYFDEWFGEGGYLISLKMTLIPDALTELYNNKKMGIVRGNGVEKYKLRDGRDLDLKTRWTATVIKDMDGEWRILALHLGTNFYDNAIYSEMSEQLKKWGMIGTALALLLGLLLGYWLRGRKAKGQG